MPLPNVGDPTWGGPLNDYILNTVQSLAQSAYDNDATHRAAVDPHGDRAYSAAQLASVTATFDAANGRAGLGADGRLKPSQAPSGGGLANTYDMIKDFGAVADGTTNNSTAFQTAFTTLGVAGGGEIWVPDGIYILHTAVKMSSNTTLRLSDGAIIKRSATSTAQYLITNWDAGSTFGGYAGPSGIKITGGTFDGNAVNNSVVLMFMVFAHGFDIEVSNVTFSNMVDYGATTFIGCRKVLVENCMFLGLRIAQPSVGWQARAVRLLPAHASATWIGSALPSGGSFLDSQVCIDVTVRGCLVDKLGSYSSYGAIFQADYVSGVANIYHQNIRVTDNTCWYTNEYAIMFPAAIDVIVTGNIVNNGNGGVWGALQSWYTTAGLFRNINISNNTFHNMGFILDSTGIRGAVIAIQAIYLASASPTNVWGHGLIISNNHIDGWATTTGAIIVTNVYDSIVTGNRVYNGTSPSGFGIGMQQCGSPTVCNNRVTYTGSNSIVLYPVNGSFPGSGSSNGTVNNNYCYGASAASISVNHSAETIVDGNQVDNSTTNSIAFTGASNNSIAIGNHLDLAISTSGSTGCTTTPNVIS